MLFRRPSGFKVFTALFHLESNEMPNVVKNDKREMILKEKFVVGYVYVTISAVS
jgi:hypothetical protein